MAQAHSPSPGLLTAATHQIAAMVEHAWETYWNGRTLRATVLVLQSLDNGTLKDIGIDRSEIESVVYGRPGDRRR